MSLTVIGAIVGDKLDTARERIDRAASGGAKPKAGEKGRGR
jgi:hypothetical protein